MQEAAGAVLESSAAPAAVAAALALLALVWFGARVLCRHRGGGPGGEGPGLGYAARDFLAHEDLVDPCVRGDHLAFNTHLHERFAGHHFVQVRGEDRCFVAFAHATCKDVLSDAVAFSSNPFPDERLVALNTMSKADHSRVLRYVHGHYTQAAVEHLEDRIQAIIERCTDELESNAGGTDGGAHAEADAMRWAKRIHMAISLMRLGVAWEAAHSWDGVDEVIGLNDAMVALVAPLGGVGRRYSTLPLGCWLSLALGLVRSVPPMLAMAARLGLRCTWQIIRPDVTVLWPPRRPRMGLWWHPELLPSVPRYFMSLLNLLQKGPVANEGPLVGLREGVARGNLQLAEALTLLVQLMVNMTSANALGSLVFRIATERTAFAEVSADTNGLARAFVQEVLRLDAPLQRNPRRVTGAAARAKGKWSDSPLREGDQVLVFLGAANMDPAIFERPGEFRLDRGEKERDAALSFGSGMHYCLGNNLVKLELRLALQSLLRRFSFVELCSCQRLVDVDVGNWGFRQLRVRLQKRVV